MFTGIVTAIGEVRSVRRDGAGSTLTIAAPYPDLSPGESVAVAGACLTVAAVEGGTFAVHVVGSTLERTRFGDLAPGDRVNLERAVRAGDPLGGHLVQGHVDGVAEVVAVAPAADGRLLDLRVPRAAWEAAIPLGSITVEGVSLTVNAMPSDGIIQVSLIPFTLERTTLGALRRGDRVHCEGDVIGKYVKAFLQGAREPGS